MDAKLRLTRKIIWSAARCLRKIVKGYVLEMDSVTIHSHSMNAELQHVFKLIQIDRQNIFKIAKEFANFSKS
jgi:hypothetical protein